jgi:hypothetical protein
VGALGGAAGWVWFWWRCVKGVQCAVVKKTVDYRGDEFLSKLWNKTREI